MATVAEHERNRLDDRSKSIWLRVLQYARPYVTMILIALSLTMVFSVGRFARAYLMKPIVDDVILPHGAMVVDSTSVNWLPDLTKWGVDLNEKLASQLESATQREIDRNRRDSGTEGDSETEAGSGLESDLDPTPGAEPDTSEGPLVLDEAQREEVRAKIRTNFLNILIAGFVIVLFMPLTSFGRQFIIGISLGRMNVDMKRDICAKLLALPLRFHTTRRRGDVYARTVSDVNSAHGALGLIFSDIAQSLLMIFVGAGLLLYISWQLALLSLIAAPIMFGVVSLSGRKIRRTARLRQRQVGEVTQRLLEILAGIKVIKAFRAEAVEEAAYRRETFTLFRRSVTVMKTRLLTRAALEFLNNFMTLGAICLGAWVVLEGRWGLTLGDLIAFGAISNQSYRPVKTLSKAWVSLMDSQAGAERFLEILDTPIEIHDAPDATEIGPIHQGVRLIDVSFSYGREPVLHHVSLEAKAGEVVAIVGRTGAGKSTLTDLLMRFYDPDLGKIEFDGVDLRQITRDSLLAQIAVVTQEPFLFDGSIRENLRYGKPDATEEEVLAAARAAHVDEFVDDLPEGFDTEVGSAGVRLSGGQRQRITIGRAILKDPSILIFDEATSSLDSQAEKYVQEAIEALLGGKRTVFVIAHRLSTVRRADKIVVIEDGTVTQSGTHDALLREGGLYRDLINLQSGVVEEGEPEPPLPDEGRGGRGRRRHRPGLPG